MLNHCKNNAIHRKINDISIVWMLNPCKNKVIHCKINDICIAWVLNHCKNNAIHRKINDICIVRMLNHCKNNAIHCKINDISIVWMLNHCKNNVIHCKINANPMRIQCRTIQIHSTPYKSHTQLTKLTQIHTNPQKSIQIHNIYIYMSNLLYSYKITCMYASPDWFARISAFSIAFDLNPTRLSWYALQHSCCFSSLILNVQCNEGCAMHNLLIVLMQMQANPNKSKQIQANQQYI